MFLPIHCGWRQGEWSEAAAVTAQTGKGRVPGWVVALMVQA